MALRETQALVLGALAAGEPLTTQQLSQQTGIATETARVAAASLTRDGWASGTGGVPTCWRITDCGSRLAATRAYREYRSTTA
ncbi:helix-turn-helix domain-containing protein [Nocardia sp. NPDC049190]|uniref:MarR family transcriptional regulator n=1 Tax=Nocardia sp. NPDC049190 TaxID=3155650 RepID=UPI0033E5F2A8